MPWEEKSSGHYERPFDSLERMYRTISAAGIPMNREHFAITAVIQLRSIASSIPDAEGALRHAWSVLRYDFPQIAAYDQGDNYVYEIPSFSIVQSWLAQTFIIEPATSSPANVYSDATPTALARMHYFPHTSEILLRSSHWRFDGIGALYLLSHFLDILAHPRVVEFGDETKNLSIGLDEAIKVATEVTPQMDREATDLIMKFVNNVPSIGLPTSANQVPGSSSRCSIKLTPQLTSAMIARCKTLGFSVTSATHAAIVQATLQHQDPHRPAKKYTSWSTFDLRKYSPPPYNGAMNPVSIFHTGIPVVVDPAGFLENAAQFREIYAQNLARPGPGNMFTFLACYVEKVCAVLTRPPAPGALPPTEPSLSSLGVIDDYIHSRYGDVEVVDFWIGVEMLTPQLMVYVWTRRGEMELSACYNTAFYTRQFVEDFLSQVKHVLLKGLGI